MSGRTPIRVVVADDHPLTREGIVASLGRSGDVRVVGEARNGEEAVMLVTTLRPDVVLMDLDMPELDGVSAIRILTQKFPGIKILVLSAYEDNQHVFTAMQAGAVGYVIKRTDHTSLLKIIRSAYQGDILVSPYLARLTLKNLDRKASHSDIHLTSREKDVLNLIIEGHDNNAIAEVLAMGRDTLKTHLKHIFEKLQVRNRTQAAVKAIEKGIFSAKHLILLFLSLLLCAGILMGCGSSGDAGSGNGTNNEDGTEDLLPAIDSTEGLKRDQSEWG